MLLLLSYNHSIAITYFGSELITWFAEFLSPAIINRCHMDTYYKHVISGHVIGHVITVYTPLNLDIYRYDSKICYHKIGLFN